jgi:hypothetical protein
MEEEEEEEEEDTLIDGEVRVRVDVGVDIVSV